MTQITEIRWKRDGWNELARWVAGFVRDPNDIYLLFSEYVDQIERVIDETDGLPDRSSQWGPPDARVVEWEFVSGQLWVTHSLVTVKRTLLAQLLGRREKRAIVISAFRRVRTNQEREALEP